MDEIALKEWTVAVRAIEAGLQDVIFRKGGIQEPEGDFRMAHTEFLLYPAREHQKVEYLKQDFHPLLAQVTREQVGQLVKIRSRARAVKYHLITSLDEAKPYTDRHIWTREFIQMRLDYKPDRPLYVIELQTTLLESPIQFVETTAYSGCRSWVSLDLS